MIETKQHVVGSTSEAEQKTLEATEEIERRIRRRQLEFTGAKDAQLQAQNQADLARIAKLQADEAARKAALEAKRVRLIAEAKRNKKYGSYVIDFEENRGFKCKSCGLVISGLGFDDHVIDAHISLEERIRMSARAQAAIDKSNADRVKQANKDREFEEERRLAREKALKAKGFERSGPIVY